VGGKVRPESKHERAFLWHKQQTKKAACFEASGQFYWGGDNKLLTRSNATDARGNCAKYDLIMPIDLMRRRRLRHRTRNIKREPVHESAETQPRAVREDSELREVIARDMTDFTPLSSCT